MNTNLIGHLAHMQTYLYIQFASESKRVFMLNHSCVFPTGHFHGNQTRFYLKGFARGLALKQRHKVTRNEYLGKIKKCSKEF